jgi:hypothetical protein
MKLRALHFLSIFFALLTTIASSLIFWLWFWNPAWGDLAIYGAIYLFYLSTPLCILGILFEIWVRYKNKGNDVARKKNVRTILLTVFNIPLAVFYLWFGNIVYNTNRITLINASESRMDHLVVSGAGDLKVVDHLEPKESKTIWYKIKQEGSLQLNYKINGTDKNITIDSYVHVGGEKYDFPIHSN